MKENVKCRFAKHWVILLTFCFIVNSDLTGVMGRNIDQLSGGELQRFAIAICCVQEADV
jgi:translation initiation factor RLI1